MKTKSLNKAEIGEGFADSKARFQKFGAELQILGQMVGTWGVCHCGYMMMIRALGHPAHQGCGVNEI